MTPEAIILQSSPVITIGYIMQVIFSLAIVVALIYGLAAVLEQHPTLGLALLDHLDPLFPYVCHLVPAHYHRLFFTAHRHRHPAGAARLRPDRSRSLPDGLYHVARLAGGQSE